MNQKNEGLICADSRFRGSIKTPVSSAACCKKADWGRVLLNGGPFFSWMRINWGFPVDEKSKWSEPWLLCRNCDRVADALSLQKIRNHRQKIQSTNDPRRKLFWLPQASWLLASRGPANPSVSQTGKPRAGLPQVTAVDRRVQLARREEGVHGGHILPAPQCRLSTVPVRYNKIITLFALNWSVMIIPPIFLRVFYVLVFFKLLNFSIKQYCWNPPAKKRYLIILLFEM